MHRQTMLASWLSAYWNRTKKLDGFDKEYSKMFKIKKMMKPEEMLAVIKSINGALGGETIGE